MKQDIVAQNPDEFSEFKVKDGEAGYYQVATSWKDGKYIDRYFIHTRATLPLKDIRDGIGFGLWVEISKIDFDKYMETENDDEKYLNFKAEGKLANNWPGFENTIGLPVIVKAVNKDEKVYIWEVKVNNTVDPLFQVALLMQKHQTETKKEVEKLVRAWVTDAKN